MLAMVWGLTHGHDPGVSRWAWVAVAAFSIPPGRPALHVARPPIPGGGGHSARSRGGGGGVCRYNGLPFPGGGGHSARSRGPKPRGSRGWYGVRGLTPSPYSVGCPWGAMWVLGSC